jgi:hypothetical protein
VYDPQVLTVDLEARFAKTEAAGIKALNVLRAQETLTLEMQIAVIEFLDMHLERGRYADQAAVTTPAVILKVGGETEKTNLKLGDRLLLSRNMEGFFRLRDLSLELWPWRIYTSDLLVTGDGAVLLFRETRDSEICTVTFPISPTQLLVIGREIDVNLQINEFIMRNCRRWVVGAIGVLTQDPNRIKAARTGAPLADGT